VSTQASKRLDGLDAVKVLAAAAIVLQHSVLRGTGRDNVAFFIYGACHVAVPTFFAVAGYIAGLRPAAVTISGFARTRARRLLIPAVFWISAFPLFAFIRAGRAPWGSSVRDWLVSAVVGGGNAWFLVVLFCVAILVAVLDRRSTRLWPAFVGLGVFVAMGLLQQRGPVGLGFGTFYLFMPVYGGVYWAALRLARSAWRPSTGLAAAAFTALTLTAGALSIARQVSGSQSWSWLMYATASVAALAALAMAVDARIPWGRMLRPLLWARESTLGIYLVHVALISYIFALVPPMQPVLRTFVAAGVTFLLTAVLVSVARRWAPARAVL
jgi:fucose 4-O-acetylase-like acetyltransferase